MLDPARGLATLARVASHVDRQVASRAVGQMAIVTLVHRPGYSRNSETAQRFGPHNRYIGIGRKFAGFEIYSMVEGSSGRPGASVAVEPEMIRWKQMIRTTTVSERTRKPRPVRPVTPGTNDMCHRSDAFGKTSFERRCL